MSIKHTALEAERSILGSLLLDNNTWKNIVSGGTTEDDFTTIEHQTAFNIIAELASNNTPFDMVTIGNIFKGKGIFNNEDSETFIFNLALNTPTATNINAYINIVKERSKERKLLTLIKDRLL